MTGKDMSDRISNVPVVMSDQGGPERIIGAADMNYETGEVTLHIGIDTMAVLQGSFGSKIHYLGLYIFGGNESDLPIEVRESAWTTMMERKEIFERTTKEEKN